MAFEKTLAIAKAEAFAVTDDGFVMSEDQLNNVEAALTEAETTAAALVTASNTVTQHEATIKQLTEEKTANAATIVRLQGEVAKMGKESSGAGTTLVAAAAAEVVEEKVIAGAKPSYDSPDHPANKFADANRKYDNGLNKK